MSITTHEATVTLGPLEDMPVKFEFEPGDSGCKDYPGYPDTAAITHVKVRGLWLPSDVFPDDWVDIAAEELLAKRTQRIAEERAEREPD